MLDALKNLKNLPQMMAQAREMQERMRALQEDLGRRQFSATGGDGLVEAIVNGRLQVLRVRIDESKFSTATPMLLEAATLAAINAAQNKAADMMRNEMGKMATDAGLPPEMLG